MVGDLGEFPLATRLFLKAYPWRRIDPVPWAVPPKPLGESRLALISTAGFMLQEQEPFDPDQSGGDPTYRLIPADAETSTFVDRHLSHSFDHAGMREDPNLAFPIDRMRELVQDGRIGSTTSVHLSFMGSILAPGRLMRDTAPAAARLLAKDHADIALLVPV